MLLARRVTLATSAVAAAAALSAARTSRNSASMAPVSIPASLSSPLADTPLVPLPRAEGAAAAPLRAGTLWADKPAVVMAVRRPGCQLCRAEASKLHLIKPQLDAAGVRLVALLHEELPEQVAEFKAQFWPGELYLDSEKRFFSAVGGGDVRRGSLVSFLNPFSRIWCALRALRVDARARLRCCSHNMHAVHHCRTNVKASKEAKVDGNFVGDGLTFGGLLVIKKTGEVEYAFQARDGAGSLGATRRTLRVACAWR
jgi:hypothetical protein